MHTRNPDLDSNETPSPAIFQCEPSNPAGYLRSTARRVSWKLPASRWTKGADEGIDEDEQAELELVCPEPDPHRSGLGFHVQNCGPAVSRYGSQRLQPFMPYAKCTSCEYSIRLKRAEPRPSPFLPPLVPGMARSGMEAGGKIHITSRR